MKLGCGKIEFSTKVRVHYCSDAVRVIVAVRVCVHCRMRSAPTTNPTLGKRQSYQKKELPFPFQISMFNVTEKC